MTRGFRIARILGIPVEVDASWFVIFALVTVVVASRIVAEIEPGASQVSVWLLALFTSVLFFASLLAHELAHSYLAQSQGVGIAGVRLFVFGGVARMDREPRSPGEEWRMAAAGPACSFALAVFFAAVTVWARLLAFEPSLPEMAKWLAEMNLALAAFNLLPGLPLDGGRLLRAAIWRRSGDFARATRVAAMGGRLTGYALIVWGLALLFMRQYWGLFSILVGLFLVSLAAAGYEQARLRSGLQGVPVREIMAQEVPAAPPTLTVQQLVRDVLPREARAAYLVLGEAGIVGQVSVRDLRRIPRERWPSTQLGEIAAPVESDRLIAPDADSWEAALRLARADYPHLFVVEEGRVVGVVRRKDLAARAR